MKLKFNFVAIYNGELIADIGEVKEIPEANGFAERWIRRGAEIVKEEVKETFKKEKFNSDIAKPLKAEQNKKENTKISAKESIKEEVL